MPSTQQAPALEGLLFTVFQQLRQAGRADGGLVIAFSSSNPGEGVTYTLQALLAGLGRETSGRTLLADSRILRSADVPPSDLAAQCYAQSENLFALAAQPGTDTQTWDGSWQYRREAIAALRQAFDYVLLDCPSLRESNDLLSAAPFVDGVILIVEADKTRKDQVLHAEKAIEFARGKLIGHILNKRSYVVPEWIYDRL